MALSRWSGASGSTNVSMLAVGWTRDLSRGGKVRKDPNGTERTEVCSYRSLSDTPRTNRLIERIRPTHRLLAQETLLEHPTLAGEKHQSSGAPEHRTIKKSRVNSKGDDVFSTLGLLVGVGEPKPAVSQLDNAATKGVLSKLRTGTLSGTNPSSSKDSRTSASASATSDGLHAPDFYVNKGLLLGMRFLVQAVPHNRIAKMTQAIIEKGGEIVTEREAGVWTIMPFAK
jgi:hypothetical protein